MNQDEARRSILCATVRPLTERQAVDICCLLDRLAAENAQMRDAARRLVEARRKSNHITMWAAIGWFESIVEGDDDVVCD